MRSGSYNSGGPFPPKCVYHISSDGPQCKLLVSVSEPKIAQVL